MKLLVHMCCAPCMAYISEDLKKDSNIYFTGIFFNPNIHPIEEFHLRRDSAILLSNTDKFNIILDESFELDFWKENFSQELKSRCNYCYAKRLDKTAQLAKEKGFDAFTSTLLISPYQNHDLIIDISNKLEKKYNVSFYYKDYRPYFREGQKIATQKNLYKQKYCGCVYSYLESDYKKKPQYFF